MTGALCLVLLGAVPALAGNALSCEILASPKGGVTELVAVVLPAKAVRGDYSFIVYSAGPGGVSTIHQGGLFDGSGSERTMLSVVTIGKDVVDSFAAELIVETEDGGRCRAVL